MPVTRKAASVASATLLTAATLGASVIGASSASASTFCHLRHGRNYPPGKCFVLFNRGTYHRGHVVSFTTGKDFHPGTRVTERLDCPGVHKSVGSDHAGGAGRVVDSFRLPRHHGHGHCTLTLTGRANGSTVTGGFTLKK